MHDLITKWVTKVVKEGTEEFYTDGAIILSLSLIAFTGYKFADIKLGGHFGHIVETYSMLQWVFQFSTFIGLGFAVHFFRQYHRAKRINKESDGVTTGRIRVLAHELEKRDETLRIERARYRKILDKQTEYVVKFLPSGELTFVNKALYSDYGFGHWEEIVGKNMYDLMEHGHSGFVKHALKSITPHRLRERHIEATAIGKRLKYVDWITCGIFSKTGTLLKYQSVGRDVTEYVLKQREVEEKEKYYRLLFTHMLSGFAVHRIICDEEDMVCDYAFVDINPAFEEMFGFTKNQVLNKTVLEIMPNTEPNLIIRFGQVAETGKPDTFECHFVDINKWFNVTVFKPEEDHFAATYIDITRRKDRTGKQTRESDNL